MAFRSLGVRFYRDSLASGLTEREKIFVFGAGGHTKVLIDSLERKGGHKIAWVCDDGVDKHDSKSRWIKN